jgi:hypothetical protein
VEAKLFFIVEASHLFRAGDKYSTQFFVMDVVHFLQHQYFPKGEAKTIVLHGSVKDVQATRYASSLERHGAQVIRMKPIASAVSAEKFYYKPTWYCHRLLGNEIPKGSTLVLIGFHNLRYRTFIEQYHKDYNISIAAFGTPSKKQGIMKIPAEFKSLVKQAIDLDDHVTAIKAEFKKSAKRGLPKD